MFWFTLIMAVVSMAMAIYAIANMPTPEMPNAEAVGLDDFKHPTADESRPIPEIFGTNLIEGINLIHMERFNTDPIIDRAYKGKEYLFFGSKEYEYFTVGHAYSASVIFALGGIVDVFRSVWIGDKKISGITGLPTEYVEYDWIQLPFIYAYYIVNPRIDPGEDGYLVRHLTGAELTKWEVQYNRNATLYMNEVIEQPEINDFADGGYVMMGDRNKINPSIAEKNKIYFYDGTQTEKIIVESKTIYGGWRGKISYGLVNSELAYNGTSLAVIPGCFFGDNVSGIPKYAFEVSRYKLTNWSEDLTEYDRIGEYDINPASAIFYILTKMLKINENDIDVEAFKFAATTLKNEGFGISFTISKINEAKKWISEILRTVDGSFYFNINTGKYTFKLFRDDYDNSLLPELDEYNSKDSKFNRIAIGSLPTSISVEYSKRDTYEKTSIISYNEANAYISDNVKTISHSYMAVFNENTIKLINNRQLKKQTYPLSTVSLKVDNSLLLMPGDVVKFSNEALGISNLIMRVSYVGGDSYEDGWFEIELVEDIFSVGEMNITTPQEPLAEPEIYEVPIDLEIYSDVLLIPQNFNTLSGSYNPAILIGSSVSNNDIVLDNLIVKQGSDTYLNISSKQNIDKHFNLITDLPVEKYITNEFIIENTQNLTENEEVSIDDWQKGELLFLIGDELVSVRKIEYISETEIKLIDIIRNIMGNSNGDLIDINKCFRLTNSQELLSNTYVGDETEYNLYYKMFVENQYNTSTEYFFGLVNLDIAGLYLKPLNIEYFNITDLGNNDIKILLDHRIERAFTYSACNVQPNKIFSSSIYDETVTRTIDNSPADYYQIEYKFSNEINWTILDNETNIYINKNDFPSDVDLEVINVRYINEVRYSSDITIFENIFI